MTGTTPIATPSTRVRVLLDYGAYAALCAAFLSLPWEIFQRTPMGITLTRGAAALLIVSAVAHWALGSRRVTLHRTLLLPVALFLGIGALTCVYSIDRDASLARLQLYGLYALLFVASAYWVHDSGRARNLLLMFVASTAAVAGYTLVCYAGWTWPASWRPSSWAIQQLIEEFRDGVPMRMAATALDLNLPAMFFAACFGASLFTFGRGHAGIRRLAVLFVLTGMFAAAVLVSMSRSGLAIMGALLLVFLVTNGGGTRSKALIISAGIASAAGVLFFNEGLVDVLTARTNLGAAGDASSTRGRVDVYRMAVGLLPKYGLQGAGLGAADVAMIEAYDAKPNETVIHSVPLLLWIELGIAGLLAYVCLWAAVVREVIRGYRAPAAHQATELRGALLAVAAAVFLMNLVQPFLAQIQFPLLAGLAMGPLADRAERTRARSGEGRIAAAVAFVVALLVLGNIISYQRTVTRVLAYNDAVATGWDAESAARWDDAAIGYANAATLVRSHSGLDSAPVGTGRYDEIAAQLVGLPALYETLSINAGVAHETAARYALGRALMTTGDLGSAERALDDIWNHDDTFEAARAALADAHWRRGHFAEALVLYAESAARDPKPHDEMNALLARDSLDDAEINSALAAAREFRRRGRWTDALTLYTLVLAADSAHADARFYMGVDAELEGDLERARAQYRDALTALPNHYDAYRRLSALESGGNPEG